MLKNSRKKEDKILYIARSYNKEDRITYLKKIGYYTG